MNASDWMILGILAAGAAAVIVCLARDQWTCWQELRRLDGQIRRLKARKQDWSPREDPESWR